MPQSLSTLHSTALVTGASSGIGRAFAEMLLAEGLRVCGTSRDPARLAPLSEKYPRTFTPLALDLDQPDAAQVAIERAAENACATGTTADALPRPYSFDIVINNAGYGAFAPFAQADFTLWRAQIDAMLTTTARLAHTVLRPMIARNRGCLVNVSSLAVNFPLPYMSAYNIAKAGLSALSESLIFETRGTNVTIIDFQPGDYRTDFNNVMRPDTANDNLRISKTWRTIDAQFNAAPPPARAARDLRRVLLRGRSCTVRSGSFFQTQLAPLAARLLPARLMRAMEARYFGAP